MVPATSLVSPPVRSEPPSLAGSKTLHITELAELPFEKEPQKKCAFVLAREDSGNDLWGPSARLGEQKKARVRRRTRHDQATRGLYARLLEDFACLTRRQIT
jgi:hypothetical protein